MDSNDGRRSLTSRYLTALLAPAVIASGMQFTWPFFQDDPISPYMLAVVFCAWYGGLGPALLGAPGSTFSLVSAQRDRLREKERVANQIAELSQLSKGVGLPKHVAK